MTKCASKSNSGLYNGINWVGSMLTYVSGNLAAAYLIGKFSLTMFYIIMTGVCLLATVYFMFLPTPQPIIEIVMESSIDEKRPLNARLQKESELVNTER